MPLGTSSIFTRKAVFTCTPPLYFNSVAGSNSVSINAVIAGKRDPIFEIKIGQKLTAAIPPFLGENGVVVAINRNTRIVTMGSDAISTQNNTLGVFGYNNEFIVPNNVNLLRASFCGAGQPGSGGHASSGYCGGGGAASSYWVDILIPVWPGQALQIICGAPGQGGAVGAVGNPILITGNVATPRTNILDAAGLTDFSGVSILPIDNNLIDTSFIDPYYLPTGRCNITTANRPTAGQATAGGKGGDGAPEYGIALGASPVGGAGATGGNDGVNGGCSLNLRGQNGWSGGAGGGGGGPTQKAGDGGSDFLHTDGDTTNIQIGGNGGSSRFGKGGVGSGALGGDGRGFGSGGAGGGPNSAGGDAGPGMCILEY